MLDGFHDAGAQTDFRKGRGRAVLIEGVRVAVFHLDRGWFALKDACPHMGASLAEGDLTEDRVICRWHGWSFDLVDGRGDNQRGSCAGVWEVRLEQGRVWLKPPPPETPEPSDAEDDAWMRADPDSWFK